MGNAVFDRWLPPCRRIFVCRVYYLAIHPAMLSSVPVIQASTANISPAAAKECIEAAKQRGYPSA
jgi:hypothetical protein